MDYDALLLCSFGGPEGPDEVLPFLDNVLRGRNVPEARKLEVAEHYHHFGGVSPINGHNRALLAAIRSELQANGPDLPVYRGNRNWHPLLTDTVASMRDDGVERALVFVTSAFGSYSGCRQYRDDLVAARLAVGAGSPELDKLRLYWDHPGFIDAVTDGLVATLRAAPADPLVIFTAHSIPVAMAADAPYEAQLRAASALVASAAGVERWELAYQSRSGPPTQPWLEPDIGDRIRELAGVEPVVVTCPIGFVSDHMEVLFDLDTEAAAVAAEVGIDLRRSPTAGTHPAFVAMVRELVVERLDTTAPRRSLGAEGPWPDACPAGCCPPPGRRPA